MFTLAKPTQRKYLVCYESPRDCLSSQRSAKKIFPKPKLWLRLSPLLHVWHFICSVAKAWRERVNCAIFFSPLYWTNPRGSWPFSVKEGCAWFWWRNQKLHCQCWEPISWWQQRKGFHSALSSAANISILLKQANYLWHFPFLDSLKLEAPNLLPQSRAYSFSFVCLFLLDLLILKKISNPWKWCKNEAS